MMPLTAEILLPARANDGLMKVDVMPEQQRVIMKRVAGFYHAASQRYRSVDKAIAVAVMSAYLQGFADGTQAPRPHG